MLPRACIFAARSIVRKIQAWNQDVWIKQLLCISHTSQVALRIRGAVTGRSDPKDMSIVSVPRFPFCKIHFRMILAALCPLASASITKFLRVYCTHHGTVRKPEPIHSTYILWPQHLSTKVAPTARFLIKHKFISFPTCRPRKVAPLCST